MFKKSQNPQPSAHTSQIEEASLSYPGIIGLGAIWEIYDMWI
ncbi:hypothetical protein [Gloeothece verrucosa]|nr:hypothetical protein [Gloeothece verrucosa]